MTDTISARDVTGPAAHEVPAAPGRIQKQDSPYYRPEVEGIRAVASLIVAAFHIWLGRVSGGVDVFFVIAGFLTTFTLLGHVRRYGRIRPWTFLQRLASRLFPAAATVLVVVVAASFVLLLPFQWIQTFTESLASALYLENWQLYRAGVDYLSQDKFHSPVQNYWAMSVQGQFYLIWAGLFLVLAVAVKLTSPARFRPLLVGALGVLIVGSFGYALLAVHADQPSAYYDTFARIWEFGLGSLMAVLLPGAVIPRALRTVAGWIGLTALVSCGFVLQVSTEFPGAAALWPTLAACAILVAGTGPGSRLGVQRLLAGAPLVWLGGLSYGLYLWHYPILVFYREYAQGQPGVLAGLGIISAALVLSWLTKRFIEDPLHRRTPATDPRARRRRTIAPPAMLLVAALVSALTLAGVSVAAARDRSESHQRALVGEPCFGAAAFADWNACSATAAWTTSFPAIDPSTDGSAVETDACMTDTTGTALRECVFGVRGSGTRVLLVGNSHPVSLFAAYEQVALQRGWELHVFYKNNCVWNTAARRESSGEARSSCLRWVDALQQRLSEQAPYAYALSGYSARKSVWLDPDGRADEQVAIDGFRATWAPLIARGTIVLALRDNPVLPDRETLDCEMRAGTIATCSVDEAGSMARRDLMVAAATDWPGAAAIDLQPYYCRDEVCPLVIGGVRVYRDLGHLTATFSLTLTPYLDAAITAAGGRR